ncbi:hypothetical protein [Streptomyces sp. NPDC057686]|uniref:hypothetical protein n=1 Tax=Streptomyces sp. NPDC057686 TaxID=3346212 RepID=UPI00369D7D23
MSDGEDDFWSFSGRPTAERRQSEPMTGLAAEIAGRFKELFYAYDNRRSADNRSAQETLGPSEIGTPCDRRIAFQLLGVPAVNPGGDGWAAFVGTCGHKGLAEMFEWANHGTGRYATEQALMLPSALVPKGTADLLDRTLCMLDDHKFLGNSSLSKLRFDGPSRTYRVQLHCYAYAAVLAGERVEHVALIAWPREAATLKGLYVWTEPYQESIAVEALARVDRIAAQIRDTDHHGVNGELKIAAGFPTADDCGWCPWHSKTKGGCRGHEISSTR